MGAKTGDSRTYNYFLIPPDFALQPLLQPLHSRGWPGRRHRPGPPQQPTVQGVVAMTADNSPNPAPAVKPAKPRPDFPLGPHPAGYWCKKIRGQIHYFGPRWHDARGAAAAADAALAEYEE